MILNLLDGPVIEYCETGDTAKSFDNLAKTIIETYGSRVVYELGGGANPILSLEYLKQQGLDYSIFDISAEELAKAPNGYRTCVMDVCSSIGGLANSADFIFSKWLVEHITNPVQFHQNVFTMLKEGGIALHYFPTLYAPPYLVNKLLPDAVSSALLMLLQKGRETKGHHGKFPAYYRWCRGPLAVQFRRFESVGFRVIKYIGLFGHAPYYEKFPLLLRTHRSLAKWLVNHPCPLFTTFAYVVLQKDSNIISGKNTNR
jgi:SAM-dependent methyltransferase